LLFIVHVLGQISGDIFIRLYKTCTPLIANCLLMQCISDSYPQRVVVFKSGAKIVIFFPITKLSVYHQQFRNKYFSLLSKYYV